MIELIITLVIAIILAAVAIPQYLAFIHTQQSVSEVNNLMDDMQFARSEALKEGQYVTICVSSSGTACTTGAWSTGWLVCSNPGYTTAAPTCGTGTSTILRVQPGLKTSDTFATNPADTTVTYNRDGFAIGVSTTTGQLFTLHNSPVSTVSTRCLWIDVLGRQYVQTSGQAAATGQGTNTCS